MFFCWLPVSGVFSQSEWKGMKHIHECVCYCPINECLLQLSMNLLSEHVSQAFSFFLFSCYRTWCVTCFTVDILVGLCVSPSLYQSSVSIDVSVPSVEMKKGTFWVFFYHLIMHPLKQSLKCTFVLILSIVCTDSGSFVSTVDFSVILWSLESPPSKSAFLFIYLYFLHCLFVSLIFALLLFFYFIVLLL